MKKKIIIAVVFLVITGFLASRGEQAAEEVGSESAIAVEAYTEI